MQRIDSRVREKILSLVKSGVTKVRDIRINLNLFLADILPGVSNIHAGNRRYHPTNTDIYNMIYNYQKDNRYLYFK